MKIGQNSFVAGELDPALYGRQDLKKYFEGAARLSNFVVQRHGGIAKRPGTDLIFDLSTIAGAGLGTEGVRIIPFLYDRSSAYVLVFVHQACYFFHNGDPVFMDDAPGTQYSLEVPYTFADLADLRVSQSGDTLFVTHSGYPPARLVRLDHAEWTYEAITFDITAQTPTNLVATVDGPSGSESSGDASYEYSYVVAAIVNGEESRPSAKVTKSLFSPWKAGAAVVLTWDAVDGAEEYRVYKKAYGSFGYIGSTVVGVGQAATPGFSLISGSSLASGYLDNSVAKLVDGLCDEKEGSPEYHKSYCIITTTDANYVYMTVDLAVARKVLGFRVGFGAYARRTNGSVVSLKPNIVELVHYFSDNGTSWNQEPAIDVVNSLTVGKQSLWITPSSHRYWKFRFKKSSILSPVCMREFELITEDSTTSFSDENIAPDNSDAPTDSDDPWADSDTYPAVMSLYQQRSVWAGNPGAVSSVLFSAVGNLYAFNKSIPQRPDDLIDVSLPLTKPGAVRHIIPMRDMIILTESGEWLLTFDQNKGLAFNSLRMSQSSYYGCNSVAPVQTGNSVLFVRRDGRGVLEYQYQLQSDGFMAQDRSILSAHLTEASAIVAMAYQQAPDSLIWAVLDDGTMIAMTYMPEHEIWAWSRHSLAGATVLDIIATGALVQKDDGDTTWSDTTTDEMMLVVRRGDQITLERMRVMINSDTPTAGQAACMDCVQRVSLQAAAVSFELPSSIPDGACTVLDVVTGTTQAGTVASGVVTVATAVRYALVGYLITSELHTLRPESMQTGVQVLRKTVRKLTLRMRRFAGGTVGALGARTPEIAIPDATPVFTASAAGDPDCTVALITADRYLPVSGMWNRDGQSSLTHASVWPMGLLCIIAELDVEGG